MDVSDSFNKLKSYCEKEQFMGWDPYDGLNSKIFRALPLKQWDLARLAWIQGFKRSPINFRKLLFKKGVSKVSIIGVGMITTPGVTYRMFQALANNKINIQVISTSEIKISVLIDKKNINKAINALHKEFKLEK